MFQPLRIYSLNESVPRAGNYDTFCKTVKEDEVIQQKKHQKEQDDIKHLKEFIASAGTYANLVKQMCSSLFMSAYVQHGVLDHRLLHPGLLRGAQSGAHCGARA